MLRLIFVIEYIAAGQLTCNKREREKMISNQFRDIWFLDVNVKNSAYSFIIYVFQFRKNLKLCILLQANVVYKTAYKVLKSKPAL